MECPVCLLSIIIFRCTFIIGFEIIYFLLISFLYVSGAFLGRECQYTS